MDSLWIFLGLLAVAALAAGVWRVKTLRTASQVLDNLYARRQGLVVELLKVADSPNPNVTHVLHRLAALEQQLSATPRPNRAPIETALSAALNELYALADRDDDLMANHDYVLIQSYLIELGRGLNEDAR
ncbi:MAG: hypothetical protein SFV19_13215 [Rhodospirillaceae bacterium]|nr:hypothetical protein [Rhodospirillaceae bacterium]